MPIVTADVLVGHELIGLKVRAVPRRDGKKRQIRGTVVDESENLLAIRTDKERRIVKVPKKGTTFVFSLEEGTDKETKVQVNGWTIAAKPEERTKRLPRQKAVWRPD